MSTLRKYIATTVKYLLLPLGTGVLIAIAVLLTPYMIPKIGIYVWSLMCLFIGMIVMLIVRRVLIDRQLSLQKDDKHIV